MIALVVDDDPGVRQMMARLVAGLGFRVLEAEDGRAALTLFAENPVALIVSDVSMPRMDGLALLAAVVGSGSSVPVILVSGQWSGDNQAEARRLGAECFHKPVPVSAFRAVVERIRAARPPSAS